MFDKRRHKPCTKCPHREQRCWESWCSVRVGGLCGGCCLFLSMPSGTIPKEKLMKMASVVGTGGKVSVRHSLPLFVVLAFFYFFPPPLPTLTCCCFNSILRFIVISVPAMRSLAFLCFATTFLV